MCKIQNSLHTVIKPFLQQEFQLGRSRKHAACSALLTAHRQCVTVATIKQPTAYEHFQFAEIRHDGFRVRKLHDDVSVCRRQVAGTLQVDRSSVWDISRVLGTDGVVPRCGRRGGCETSLKPTMKLAVLSAAQTPPSRLVNRYNQNTML